MDKNMYEKFEITDYDLENEFNINRPRRKLTKKQQIYGVWADDDSDEDDEPRASTSKKAKGPVSFVPGGSFESNKPSETNHKMTKDKDGDDDEDARPSFGSNIFMSANEVLEETAGFRSAVPRLNTHDRQFGNWEKHTKGIGAKLLLQMGYQPGKGLGKNLQGISAPIEAKVRQSKGTENMQGNAPLSDPKKSKKDVPVRTCGKESSAKDRFFSDRKVIRDKPKSTIVYDLTDDLLDSERTHGNKGIKIIDMTGPNQRILSGMHELHMKNRDEADDEDLLNQRNVLIDMDNEKVDDDSDRDHLTSQITFEQHKLRQLETERHETTKIIEYDQKQLDAIGCLLTRISDFNKNASFELIFDLIENLKWNCFNDPDFNCNVLRSLAFPYVRQRLSSWNAFQNSSEHFAFFERFRNETQKTNERMYDFLLWEVWYPVIRRQVAQQITMKEGQTLIKFLEKWRALLPNWLLSDLLEQQVLPRLIAEVNEWNPLQDPVPIHSWIHPWLDWFVVSDLEQAIFGVIRSKLSSALSRWHPSDGSAKIILKPWQDVFEPDVWTTFIRQNICSKLDASFGQWQIDPSNQRMDEWQWFVDWHQVAADADLVRLLEKHFFPRWLRVLYDWLNADANFDEVCDWFLGWKTVLPAEWLFDQPVVGRAFTIALSMMDCAVSRPGGIASYILPTIQSTAPAGSAKFFDRPASSGTSQSASNSLSFRQLVERKAADLGIMFIPVSNRLHAGKQLYQFGRVQIYFEQNVIFTLKNQVPTPISMQSLLEKCT